MEHKEQVGTPGNSGRGIGVAERTLYPLVTRRLTATVVPGEESSVIQTSPAVWGTLISVWWDHPPCADSP